ncbi:gamma-glutamylcysteine synthetase light chain [Fusarium subglutinans]|uniref:GCS light chain n=1 Tax=Gibberella subglutinans TaxID=42677 RepID=A0A8H5UXF5_GIBSU|nr:gamma-glutamylcysteine synthetase light chain [Fusarium subglutinans]KAF5602957.1 gamma-glutamylcysteine synthetase light chain [Fusarium subglutinans]
MTRLILSTANVMLAGPSIIRKPGNNRSNLELVNSLRDNIAEAQRDYAIDAQETNGFTNGDMPKGKHTAVDLWTEQEGDALYVPRINWNAAGLQEEPSQYEITVKFFVLSGMPVAAREQHVKEALDLVRRELGIQTIDLLIVSFPGISFEGNCEWEADKTNAQQGNLEEELATWKVFEGLHKQGLVKRLAVAEFGSEKLGAFIKRASVRPVIDQINLRNCCDVPPPLKKLAEEEGVELHVHNDCIDILPHGTLRELLSHEPKGAGLLADPGNSGAGLTGEIVPEWVVRYTAFVQDRGVIENKGYFAGAELVAP